jgi:hypothetical protein
MSDLLDSDPASDVPRHERQIRSQKACSPTLLLVAAALFAGCATSREFPKRNQSGNYADPDVVVFASPNEEQPLPRQLDCPARLVIYCADVQAVPNCANAGPVPARLIANAAGIAARYAAQSVTCEEPCVKQMSLLWVGWKCGGNPATAVGAAEVLVECVPPGIPEPGEVTP